VRRSVPISKNEEASTTNKKGLAARLKQLRAEHGLSLAQLARATGISSSFLSLVEQAQSDITIGRLVRLAEFYDIELADLLNGPPTAPGDHVRILRASTEHMMHSPMEGVEVYDLAGGARWTLVPMLSTFEPGGSIDIDDEHEHERMVYVLDGTIELAFHGETPTRLRTGEGAVFHSVGRYRISNVGRGQGRILGVRMHPPT
jgi:transcriptional regulator with XRE-family HTH domain